MINLKSLLASLIAFILMTHVVNTQSFFKTTDLVDEFGDKIGEVQRNVAIGTFSNSATTNSRLRVHSILTESPYGNTLEEYKESLAKTYTDKQLKTYLKHAEKSFVIYKNINGTISFDLFEYEDLKASMIGVKSGTISIKTDNGTKIKASLNEYSFMAGRITINGYKELTTGARGIKQLVISGLYDWKQTEIYDSIVNATGSTDVVISFGNSTYKFTIN